MFHELDVGQKIEILQALLAILIPNIGGVVVALAVDTNKLDIFNGLNRPTWATPVWLFISICCIFYCVIGFASYLVFRNKQFGKVTVANVGDLIVYGLNLVFSWSWGLIFFGKEDIHLALMDMVIVDATALLAFYLFRKAKPLAGYLLIPYIIWSIYVTTLNCAFVDLN